MRNKRFASAWVRVLTASCLLVTSGCLSPISLNRAVIAYDEAIIEAQSKQLLVNIARAQHHQPIHFTGVSNVAATFDFRFTAGATPALTGNAGGTILPVIAGSVAENPTISIAPIEGEEFTQRLLTPFHEAKLTLLLRQGIDIDLLLRLMAKELRLKHRDGVVAYRNNPSDKVEYHVDRDSRTPEVAENPIKTMDLVVSPSSPSGMDLVMRSHGNYYAVNTTGPQARWNREAFKLLSQLSQMTVTEVSRAGVPSITIAQ